MATRTGAAPTPGREEPSGPRRRPSALLSTPLRDLGRGLDRCLAASPWALLRVAAGLLVGWWFYVPIHELLHAGACLAAGGSVSRLEIAPLYGGTLLARLLPFVAAGGRYAGRLTRFDTGGSDLVYLLTDLGPYLLTVLPGVGWFRRAGSRGQAFLFGAAMPLAAAPFLALTGDAYEIGSLAVTRLPAWAAVAARQLLRGDDVAEVAGRLATSSQDGALLWAGLALATIVGAAWAFTTYAVGAAISRFLLGQGPVPPRSQREERS